MTEERDKMKNQIKKEEVWTNTSVLGRHDFEIRLITTRTDRETLNLMADSIPANPGNWIGVPKDVIHDIEVIDAGVHDIAGRMCRVVFIRGTSAVEFSSESDSLLLFPGVIGISSHYGWTDNDNESEDDEFYSLQHLYSCIKNCVQRAGVC